jgi:hypothetical protein
LKSAEPQQGGTVAAAAGIENYSPKARFTDAGHKCRDMRRCFSKLLSGAFLGASFSFLLDCMQDELNHGKTFVKMSHEIGSYLGMRRPIDWEPFEVIHGGHQPP